MTTILTYHRIEDVEDDAPKSNLYVSPAEFEQQIIYLKKKKYLFVTLESVVNELRKQVALPQNSVAITFDDTTIDNYRFTFPILKKHEAKATFFVIADRALNLIDDGEQRKYATIDQIREMTSGDLVDVGSHSCTHCRLADLTDGQLNYEIIESRDKLQSALDREISFFSYPFGNFDERVMKFVKRAKYFGATASIRDNRNRRKHIFHLKRVMVMRKVTMKHFAFYFSPLYHLEHYRKNKKLWGKYK